MYQKAVDDWLIYIWLLIVLILLSIWYMIWRSINRDDKFIWKCEAYQWKVIDSVCIKDNKVLFYNK